MFSSSPLWSSAPMRRIAKIAVEPVPSPTVIPDLIEATAYSAASFFKAA
jgi:hypothetical protein